MLHADAVSFSSDPTEEFAKFCANIVRGGGHCFGPLLTSRFLKKNKLKQIIRGHEVPLEGIKVQHGDQCITLTSSPNFGGVLDNHAGILRFSNSTDSHEMVESARKKSVVDEKNMSESSAEMLSIQAVLKKISCRFIPISGT